MKRYSGVSVCALVLTASTRALAGPWTADIRAASVENSAIPKISADGPAAVNLNSAPLDALTPAAADAAAPVAQPAPVPSPVPTMTATGIPLDAPWKVQEYLFARKVAVHPAWGLPHFERDYRNAEKIARRADIVMDKEVLFAAAFLHDIGGFAPYEDPNIDHGLRSAQVAEPLLKAWGFPMEKFPQVSEMMIGHPYYLPPPKSPAAVAFRDADILDFLGNMGIARILSITEDPGFTHTLGGALTTLKQFAATLPPKLLTSSARELAPVRVKEMKRFFDSMENYSFGGKVL